MNTMIGERQHFNRRMNVPGFSLLELMVYITIVGLIVVGVATMIVQVRKMANKSSTMTTMKSLGFGIDNFYADTGQYPATLKDLIVKPQGEGFDSWDGPYGGIKGKTVPKNPWGIAYTYQVTEGGKHPYELTTKTSSGAKLSVWEE